MSFDGFMALPDGSNPFAWVSEQIQWFAFNIGLLLLLILHLAAHDLAECDLVYLVFLDLL